MDSEVVDGLFLGERKERIAVVVVVVYLGGCGLEAIQGERLPLLSTIVVCSTIAQLYRRYRMNTMELSVGESVLHLEQRRRYYHGFIRAPTS